MQIPISPNTLNIGLTVEALVAELEENFPVVQPHPNDPDRMIMYKSGQRAVVEWVKNRIEEETN